MCGGVEVCRGWRCVGKGWEAEQRRGGGRARCVEEYMGSRRLNGEWNGSRLLGTTIAKRSLMQEAF